MLISVLICDNRYDEKLVYHHFLMLFALSLLRSSQLRRFCSRAVQLNISLSVNYQHTRAWSANSGYMIYYWFVASIGLGSWESKSQACIKCSKVAQLE